MKYQCDSLERRVINMDWAVAFGLVESLICQQILYWCQLNRSHHRGYKDGHHWTYNTFKDWQDQFPCYSILTLKRAVAKLKGKGLIIVAEYNESKWDHTKWYRLNPEHFNFDDSPLVKLAPVDAKGKAKGYHEGDKFVKFPEPVELA